ncbi:hypothetical protein KBTX_04009 [wastewater metagenome]|uniref:Uncharacterized protein n=2 Tax=unclassified sequences TaxID=12908 RepID=A0A5B8RF32_9ZZZZ|nr:hypothetical protein KBTEX_04009 [uncultured organism]
MVPMFSEAISGCARSAACMRSCTVMGMPPPVEMFTTASVAVRIRGRKRMNTPGSGVGRPSSGLRAWRWSTAAPASAAPMACSAICSGVTGRYSLMVGVCTEPVTAQVMMTLRVTRRLR